MRAELADAKAALTHALSRSAAEGGASRYEDVNARDAIDGIPGFVAILAADGNVEVVNRQIMKYSGRTREELRDWNAIGIVHDDDASRNAALFLEAIVHGMPYDHEIRLRRHDGVFRWFSNRGVPIMDDNGNVLRWYVLLTDIDDLKRAEERADASQRQLQRAIDATPALIWSGTRDGHTDSVNQYFVDYMGWTYQQLKDSDWQIAIHPDDRAGLNAVWSGLRSTGQAGQAEARLRRHDGEYRWFLLRTHPLLDEGGNVIRWYGVNTDIEDRKRAEQKLARSERDLQETVDAIPIQVICNTITGLFVSANQPWYDYTGYSPQAAKGTGWQLPFHPADRPHLIAAWTRMLRSGEGGDVEGRLRRSDGVYRWFLMRSSPLRNEDRKILRWYSTVTDIEDRKQAEADLQRAYRDLAEAQRLSSTGSFTNDYYGGTHQWSDELYRIFQFERRGPTVERDAIIDRLHPDDRVWLTDAFAESAKTGKDIDAYFRIVLPDGGTRHLHLTGHATGWQEGRPVIIGAVQDITETKHAEIALDRARSELAHAARVMSLGVLTASIAHEVNQPLAGIITNANTCQRMLSADPPNLEGARETLRRTIRDGYRASEVITRLRTLFSKKDFAAEFVDLNDAVREVLAMTQDEMGRRRIVIRTQYEEPLPRLMGDRVQLQQVVLNLLLNASDAMGEVHAHAREICLRTHRESDTVCMSIRDTGSGIAPDVLKRLFEPFFTTKDNGMGIGLSVSRSIIERHNGKLWAVPNDGPGTTFSFSIPLKAAAASTTQL